MQKVFILMRHCYILKSYRIFFIRAVNLCTFRSPMLENGGGRGRQCSWSWPEEKVWGPAQQIHQCGQGLAVQVYSQCWGSANLVQMRIRIRTQFRIRIQFSSWRNPFFFFRKCNFFKPQGSMKDVQATGEAFSPQTRTSSTSKHEIFSLFCP